MKHERGLSFIEVMIASMLVAIITSGSYLLIHSSQSMSREEMTLRDAEFQAALAVEKVLTLIRESDSTLIKQNLARATFTDSKFAKPQSVAVIPSARDPVTRLFQRAPNQRPIWSHLVVFAPYYDPVLKRGVLREYKVTDPAAVTAFTTNTGDAVVTGSTITLTGASPISRSSGTQIVDRLQEFIVAEDGVSALLRCQIILDRTLMTSQTNSWNGVRADPPLKPITPVPPALRDDDNDGLYDVWEVANFGTTAANPLSDPDGDGATNLQEFQAGTDPNAPPPPPPDQDGDGIPDSSDPDKDGDGVIDPQPPSPPPPPDQDGDGIPDSSDPDKDGDGIIDPVPPTPPPPPPPKGL
jgi:hypothetical protein